MHKYLLQANIYAIIFWYFFLSLQGYQKFKHFNYMHKYSIIKYLCKKETE